jgi:uncharacterized protein YjiS (DUF1127 family)
MTTIHRTAEFAANAERTPIVTTFFRWSWTVLQERRKRARLRAALYALPDRDLRDIGISRTGIEHLALNGSDERVDLRQASIGCRSCALAKQNYQGQSHGSPVQRSLFRSTGGRASPRASPLCVLRPGGGSSGPWFLGCAGGWPRIRPAGRAAGCPSSTSTKFLPRFQLASRGMPLLGVWRSIPQAR